MKNESETQDLSIPEVQERFVVLTANCPKPVNNLVHIDVVINCLGSPWKIDASAGVKTVATSDNGMIDYADRKRKGGAWCAIAAWQTGSQDPRISLATLRNFAVAFDVRLRELYLDRFGLAVETFEDDFFNRLVRLAQLPRPKIE